MKIHRKLLGAVSLAVFAACAVQSPAVKELNVQRVSVQSPVKAHLTDGSTVIYPYGVERIGNNIVGRGGMRYAIGSTTPTPVNQTSLDTVVGLETYTAKQNIPASVALSLGATAIGVVATAAAAVAIFGSCPTFYADSAGHQLLQAEAFSYAVAPLFEQRDVDRLTLTPTPDGRVVLHIRNEALETHYINNLELIEVDHRADEFAVPDAMGRPVAISRQRMPYAAHDRSGRDVANVVRSSDDKYFSTSPSRLASVNATDLQDHIDIVLEAPAGADSVALLLNMRNSLLNTVLLYDHILGAPGLKSLDYLGKDLERISNAVDMGRWYATNMGMHVSVFDNGEFREVYRLGDSGPIAFHESVVLVPALRGADDSVRLRLSFAADDWRINEIGIAATWRRPSSRSIPVSQVHTANPEQDSSARRVLTDPDEDYLITVPGQSFYVEFNVGTTDITQHTWFAVSQGYYTEWVRAKWIQRASGKPFVPSNAALLDAMNDWRSKQSSMEREFYNSKIPTR